MNECPIDIILAFQPSRSSAITDAVIMRSLPALRILLKVLSPDEVGDDGVRPIQAAMCEVEMMKILLAHGAIIAKGDLHLAATISNDAVKELLKNSANSLEIVNGCLPRDLSANAEISRTLFIAEQLQLHVALKLALASLDVVHPVLIAFLH